MNQKTITELSKIDIVILCGGLGNRLRPIISDKPKVLAKIGDKIFLDILLDNLLPYKFENIILCVGHLRQHIIGHFDHYFDIHKNCNIKFSEEEKPLGTGGALKNAKSLIENNNFIVMNGDSICKIDFKDFFDFHIGKNALLSMVLSQSLSTSDYGTITLNDLKEIVDFNEKGSHTQEIVSLNEKDSNVHYKKLINAGIYLMRKDIFSYMPDNDIFSLEYDLFPKIIERQFTDNTKNMDNKCYGFLSDSEVIDIGTPERYERSLWLLTKLGLVRQ